MGAQSRCWFYHAAAHVMNSVLRINDTGLDCYSDDLAFIKFEVQLPDLLDD